MSLESDIERLKVQEQRLRFEKFDEADAWKLGTLMRDAAMAQKLPLVIDIRVAGRPLFYVALPGTSPENPDWVRRKVNTVSRFHKSSYRIGREYELQGRSISEARGMAPLDFAREGGGFPIHVIGTGVVGSVAVSGIPQREDHNFVAECLSGFLGVDHAQIALPPEAA